MTGQPLIKVNDWSREDRKRQLLSFWVRMAPVLVKAVEGSFVKAKMVTPTRAEAARRTKVAKQLVQDMSDLRFSTERIKDTLPLALDAKLAGLEFDLEALGKRVTW